MFVAEKVLLLLVISLTDDAICLVAQFTSCIAEPSEYFPQRFLIERPRTAFNDYWLWYVYMIAYPFQQNEDYFSLYRKSDFPM